MMRCLGLLGICLGLGLLACQATKPLSPLEGELTQALRQDLWERWFPTCVDTLHGGYFTNLAADWQVSPGPQPKVLVTQARHLWSASQAANVFPEDPRYAAAAAHGYTFLREQMWDPVYGGFYQRVDPSATSASIDQQLLKYSYGNAFAIYGLAAYYGQSKSPGALYLAQETFRWLDRHAYDEEHGGYFPFLSREGKVVQALLGDSAATHPPYLAYKDQNPTIHLLEAFTELYQYWPDSLLRVRLEEQLHLVRDVITQSEGYMGLYFTQDWQRISYRDSAQEIREAHYQLDHVSFGHDVETAYLILEACEVLGGNCESTLRKGKAMLDHSLFWGGFDWEKGGFFEQGYYHPGQDIYQIIDRRKNWWAQAEGLHTLLLYQQHFPEEQRYADAFDLQWTYIQTYLLDPKYGGWYSWGVDESPEAKAEPKGHAWKGSYHTGRALMRCRDLLREAS
ncbi:MAG: AGE family epimerase/isomerase [Bacteroidota bacterium]